MKTKLLSIALLTLVLSACDKVVEIKDGQLPADLVPFAQTLTGTYLGNFSRSANELKVALDGNRLSVTPKFG
jgi:hypothetical protein